MLASGCKENGCTDKNALNFNIVANKEDGTCYYCTSSTVEAGKKEVDVSDFNTPSFFGKPTFTFFFTQTNPIVNDTRCGFAGSVLSYKVRNNSSTYEASFSYQINTVGFTPGNTIVIAPNQTIEMPPIILNQLATTDIRNTQINVFISGSPTYKFIDTR